MKVPTTIQVLLAVTMSGVAQAAPEVTALSHKFTVIPEIKLAFQSADAIEFQEVTGTTPSFQVGGTYRIKGICRQHTLKHAILYVGNTSEPGANAIAPVAGSSLYQTLPDGSTAFDCTFTLLRPGILHATIYDADSRDQHNTAHEGVYLGDVVFKH